MATADNTDPPADLTLDLWATWRLVHASDEDLRLVELSVRQAACGLSDLASSDDVRRPVSAVPAFQWTQSPANWPTGEGSTHVENALGGVRTSCLAAADHMEVLVDSSRRGGATVAVWTLTRTVLETLGRVNYLLDAEDDLDFLTRHVALICGEMQHAKHGTQIVRGVGRLDVDEYRSSLKLMIQEIGGTALRAPSYTTLATNLLEDAAPGNGSRMRYSQLSGVAHGELTALQMFATDDDLVLPRALLVEAAHMVCAASILVGDKLCEATVLPGSPVATRWIAIRNGALSAAFALQPGGGPETDLNETVTQN